MQFRDFLPLGLGILLAGHPAAHAQQATGYSGDTVVLPAPPQDCGDSLFVNHD